MVIKIIKMWLVPFLIATVLLNIVTMFYYHPANEIYRESGATPGIYVPGEYTIYDEGHGIHVIDDRGYVNKFAPEMTDIELLAVGSSNTEGFEIPRGKRWSDLLNRYLQNKFGDDKIVYNIGHSGFYYPEIVKRFKCIVGEFKGASIIVIEITDTCFEEESVEDALKQYDYRENTNSNAVLSEIDVATRIKCRIKSISPLLRLFHKQIIAMKAANDVTDSGDSGDNNGDDNYETVISESLELIRKEFDGEIYIIYHPRVVIDNGGLSIETSYTDRIFEKACQENGIKFIDLTDSFKKAYSDSYVVPYGFDNTSPGTGHLNEEGHKILADELLESML